MTPYQEYSADITMNFDKQIYLTMMALSNTIKHLNKDGNINVIEAIE